MEIKLKNQKMILKILNKNKFQRSEEIYSQVWQREKHDKDKHEQDKHEQDKYKTKKII